MTAMFIDCPFCGFLVAVDDQGRPLPRCPNCAQRLRDDAEDAAPVPNEAAARTVDLPQPRATMPGDAQLSASPETTPAAVGVAKPAREQGDRKPSVEASPADAEQPQAARNDAAEAMEPAAEAEVASVPAEAAMPGPVHADPEPMGATLPAGDATANAVVAAIAGTVQPDADASPGATPASASDGPIAPAAPLAPPDPPMPQDLEATAAGPQPTDATADTTLPAPEEPHEAPDATTVADADVIAELVQRETPVEAEIEAPTARGAPETGEATSAAVAERVAAASVATAGPEAEAAMPSLPAPVAPARTPARPRATPSFVRKPQATAPRDRRRLLLRCSAVAALSLLLALQLLLSERARLAADAGWRPLLASLCGVLRCSLPAWREPLAFELLERDVRAHPSLPGVLRVSARIRNGARWPQAWPVLQLTFSDVHGRSVATRLFQPREYLGGAPTQSVLGRGQVAGISMDVIEPGAQAVAFTFDFK